MRAQRRWPPGTSPERKRESRRSHMHLWTGVQLLLFAVLYVVKTVKAVAIAFPLVIAACIPVRTLLMPPCGCLLDGVRARAVDGGDP